jgi:heme exporter protein D
VAEFFQMGGYAMFVWPSYALAGLVLWLNWYLPRKQHDKELRQLRRRHKGEQK